MAVANGAKTDFTLNCTADAPSFAQADEIVATVESSEDCKLAAGTTSRSQPGISNIVCSPISSQKKVNEPLPERLRPVDRENVKTESDKHDVNSVNNGHDCKIPAKGDPPQSKDSCKCPASSAEIAPPSFNASSAMENRSLTLEQTVDEEASSPDKPSATSTRGEVPRRRVSNEGDNAGAEKQDSATWTAAVVSPTGSPRRTTWIGQSADSSEVSSPCVEANADTKIARHKRRTRPSDSEDCFSSSAENSGPTMSADEPKASKKRRKSASTVPKSAWVSFPEVVHNMVTVTAKTTPDVIKWVSNGEAFVVSDTGAKLGSILKQYFRHEKYSSFQRQLNMYGWKKHLCGRYRGAFHHPCFHRDRGTSSELAKIIRNSQASINASEGQDPDGAAVVPVVSAARPKRKASWNKRTENVNTRIKPYRTGSSERKNRRSNATHRKEKRSSKSTAGTETTPRSSQPGRDVPPESPVADLSLRIGLSAGDDTPYSPDGRVMCVLSEWSPLIKDCSESDEALIDGLEDTANSSVGFIEGTGFHALSRRLDLNDDAFRLCDPGFEEADVVTTDCDEGKKSPRRQIEESSVSTGKERKERSLGKFAQSDSETSGLDPPQQESEAGRTDFEEHFGEIFV